QSVEPRGGKTRRHGLHKPWLGSAQYGLVSAAVKPDILRRVCLMLRLRGLPQGSLRKVKNNKTAPFPYRTSSMPAFGLRCCDRCHSYSSNNPLFFWTPPIYFWTTSEAWRSCAAVPDFRV